MPREDTWACFMRDPTRKTHNKQACAATATQPSGPLLSKDLLELCMLA